jgi:hypothetical protein
VQRIIRSLGRQGIRSNKLLRQKDGCFLFAGNLGAFCESH